MKVKVTRLHEDRGRPLGKWREAFRSGALAELHLGERNHKVWGRHTKTATLLSLVPGEGHVFLHIDDAEVLVIHGNVMRITGTETDELTRHEYKQTWHCELV